MIDTKNPPTDPADLTDEWRALFDTAVRYSRLGLGADEERAQIIEKTLLHDEELRVLARHFEYHFDPGQI